MSDFDKEFVRYDELIQLLADKGFSKNNDSYNTEKWINNRNEEFFITPDELYLPLAAVEFALKNANISIDQLDFYKMRYRKK